MRFLKNDLMTFGMTFGIILSTMLYLMDMLKIYLFLFILSMFSFFLMLKYLKTKVKIELHNCFFAYVDDMWVCCSNSEEPRENTNTIKEGFNGDWFYNMVHNFLGCTGDITRYDFKVIACSSEELKIPILDKQVVDRLNIGDKKKHLKAKYYYGKNGVNIIFEDETI